MELRLPVDEYFKYHPPKTEARQKLHEAVNEGCKQAYLDLVAYHSEPDDFHYWGKYQEIQDRLVQLIESSTQDELCKWWAMSAVQKLPGEPAGLLMVIQQIRMFLNQGITVDEIVRERAEQPQN